MKPLTRKMKFVPDDVNTLAINKQITMKLKGLTTNVASIIQQTLLVYSLNGPSTARPAGEEIMFRYTYKCRVHGLNNMYTSILPIEPTPTYG